MRSSEAKHIPTERLGESRGKRELKNIGIAVWAGNLKKGGKGWGPGKKNGEGMGSQAKLGKEGVSPPLKRKAGAKRSSGLNPIRPG